MVVSLNKCSKWSINPCRKHTIWSTIVGLVVWVDISQKINDLLPELVFFEKYAPNFIKISKN